MLGFLIIGLCALSVIGWYLYHWDLFFNSDFAMIGLIGKRILETGEQFIFVPKVGYQGLLIEGNLSALLFKLFGISPVVLHLTAALAFCVFLFVFYQGVKVWFSKHIALIASVVLCFSSPLFFGNVLRTQPNYPETYALGCSLFWLYKKYLDTRNQKYFYWACFIAGFGFYLYGQIIYFVASIVLSIFWSLIEKREGNLHRALRRPAPLVLIGLALALLPTLKPAGFKIGGPTFGIVLFLFWFFKVLKRNSDSLKFFWANHKTMFLKGLGIFLLGYSPTLYYRFVLGKGVFPGFKIIKYSEEFWQNLKMLILYFDDFMMGGIPSVLSTGLSFAFLLIFLRLFWRSLAQKERVLNPFWILGGVVLALFLSSRSSGDYFTVRYVLCWQLILALIAASLVMGLFERRKILASVLLALFLSYKVWVQYRIQATFENNQLVGQLTTWREAQEIVPFLRENQLSWGYSDYWAAYLTNFVSQGEFTLEPLYSNYLPFYEEAIKAQDRIALVKSKVKMDAEPDMSARPELVEIKGNRYRIEKDQEFKHWWVWVLRKV